MAKASASNIDVNGNGVVDASEANVRTVPTRISMTVPALEKCNDSVTLTDVISTTGSAAFAETTSNLPVGLISTTQQYSSHRSRYILEMMVALSRIRQRSPAPVP